MLKLVEWQQTQLDVGCHVGHTGFRADLGTNFCDVLDLHRVVFQRAVHLTLFRELTWKALKYNWETMVGTGRVLTKSIAWHPPGTMEREN